MALWQKICSQPDIETHMKNYYSQKCQSEIRSYFAPWIEEKIMAEKYTVNDSFEQYALQFYEDLRSKLANAASNGDNTIKSQLNELCNKINHIPAADFYAHLRDGIQKELQLVETMSRRNFTNGMDQCDELYKITVNIQELNASVEFYKRDVEKFNLDCDKLLISYNELAMINSSQGTNQIAQNLIALQATVNEEYRMICTCKLQLIATLRKIVGQFEDIKTCVIDKELKNWQRNQALAGNGAPFRDNLDDIQHCIEVLIEISCRILVCINAMIVVTGKCNSSNLNMGNNNEFNDMRALIEKSKQYIILSAFIVEKQPPQVMKTNTRFSATVRWLIGPQLGITMSNPMVECIILSESQAQRYCGARQVGDPKPGSSGEILNSNCQMEYMQQTRHFSVNFRNMQLKKIKRTEKKGTESVMDEKFALLFYTNIDVNSLHNSVNDVHNGTNYKITAWTLSLPVVVIVHGNQEPQSWATITWDNAFSEISREPFVVPDHVPWSYLSLALNTKFHSATGRALTDENMNFLFEKVFRGDITNDYKEVNWTMFCKEPLPDRQFTFWDWFFAIMKLTKDHILKPWQAGRIVGFINKQRTTEEILKPCPEGTFLVRFSDSELGGISIAFVNDISTVLMLQPWTAKDLQVLPLQDRIKDIPSLKYLYPNICKEEAFGEFYTITRDEEQNSSTGYVKNRIKAVIPALEENQQATTPQHSMIASPSSRDIDMTSGFDNIYQPDFYDIIQGQDLV